MNDGTAIDRNASHHDGAITDAHVISDIDAFCVNKIRQAETGFQWRVDCVTRAIPKKALLLKNCNAIGDANTVADLSITPDPAKAPDGNIIAYLEAHGGRDTAAKADTKACAGSHMAADEKQSL
jgi:hypothetical protein